MVHRVACIGDSNTAGYRGGGFGNSRISKNNYPAVLQRLLGDQYVVENLGASNTTLTKAGQAGGINRPAVGASYWDTKQFQRFVGAQWDIVIIALGGNNAKTKANGAGVDNWPGEDPFAADYAALIQLARTLGPGAQSPLVFVCTPSPLLLDGKGGGTQSIVNDVMQRLMRRIASDHDAHLIDFFAALGGKDVSSVPAGGVTADFVRTHPTPPAIYYYDENDPAINGTWCDQVHPADAGFVRMAEVAADAIRRHHIPGPGGHRSTWPTSAVVLLVTLTAVVAGARLWRGAARA